MQFITPTNDPFARIGFAQTYGELTDEYNYSSAPKYTATFSNATGGFWDLFSTQRSRDRKAAENEALKAKTQLDLAIAAELGKAQQGGMGTGTKIAIGVGILAMVGVTIWALRS